MTKALVMAGGRSERMRLTGECHKALVHVLGIPLIERNLRMLLESGFSNVSVAVCADEAAILAFLDDAGRSLVHSYGGTIAIIVEHAPLGTIGAARLAARDVETLLAVNVDNLTTLDLQRFVGHHLESSAALTIASHVERPIMPFGELRIVDGDVEAYLEKPELRLQVSSGTYVLSRRAIACIPESGATSIPQLFERLRMNGERIAAYEHEAPWIDINDRAAVLRAEALVAAHREQFEPWTKTAAL